MTDFSKVKYLCSIAKAHQAPKPELPAVAFAGRSNVGKSSLINTLVQRKGLARTSSTPGHTRKIHYYDVDDRIHFVDLPGYGYAKVSKTEHAKWGPMVEGYLRDNSNLRLVVVILDARRKPSEQDLQLVEWLQAQEIPYLFAVTKIDKVKKTVRKGTMQAIVKAIDPDGEESIIPFSATKGIGRKELIGAILKALKPGTN